MKVPPIIGVNCRANTAAQITKSSRNKILFPTELTSDTVTFSSNAQYYKKYATLPEDIKEILRPQDAVDMFKDMELVASGKVKRERIGQGKSSNVYRTPWLDNYYFVVLSDADLTSQIIYSKSYIGDAVWQDKDNACIQLLSAV